MMRRLWIDTWVMFEALEHPVWALLCYGFFAAAAVVTSRSIETGDALSGAFAFICGLLLVASQLGRVAGRFMVDSRAQRLPGTRSLVRRFGLVASVCLTAAAVIPGAAVAASPVPGTWVPVLAVLAATAAVVLVPAIPVIAMGLLILALPGGYWVWGVRDTESIRLIVTWSLICSGCAFGTVEAWRQAIRGRAPRSRLYPILQRLWSVRRRNHVARRADAGTTAHRVAHTRVSAVRVIRTTLGGGFMFAIPLPLDRRSPQWRAPILILLLSLSLAVVLGVAIAVLPHDRSRTAWAWVLSVILAAGPIVGWLSRLSHLRGARMGELSELALFPGLGDSQSQRLSLYRAALVPPCTWLCVIAVLVSVALLWEGFPWSSAIRVDLYLLILWLTYVAHALLILSGNQAASRVASEDVTIWLVLGAVLLSPLASDSARVWSPSVWLAPLLFAAGLAVAILRSARKLAAAPHPFLQDLSRRPIHQPRPS